MTDSELSIMSYIIYASKHKVNFIISRNFTTNYSMDKKTPLCR